MKIFVEFTAPKKSKFPLFSWIIRAVQGTKYSHVRLRWENSVGTMVVYEASGSSVKFLGPLAQENNKVAVVKTFKIDISRQRYRELVKLCMENAGIDYGIKQVIGIGLVKLLKLKKNPFSDGRKSQVCSEIVGRFLEDVMNWDTGLDLDTAGPKELDVYLTAKLQEIKV